MLTKVFPDLTALTRVLSAIPDRRPASPSISPSSAARYASARAVHRHPAGRLMDYRHTTDVRIGNGGSNEGTATSYALIAETNPP